MTLTLATYLAGLAAPSERVQNMKASGTVVAGQRESAWQFTPFAGATPATNAAVDSTTVGSIGQSNSTATRRYVIGWNVALSSGAGSGAHLLLVDRLVNTTGLDGTVTTEQTTNLPTTALTRYSGGAGVWAAYEVYTTQVGTTTTLSIRYTNQAGTGSRVSPLMELGSAGASPVGAFRIMPFAAGDTGVRSVEGVTNTVTTATAGNAGITLFKPLMHLPVPLYAYENLNTLKHLATQFSQIIDGACLQFAVMSSGGSSQGHSAEILFLDV